jgi:hypothetical protein
MPCSRSRERWRAWSAAALLALVLGCLRPPGPPPVPAGRDPLTVLRERAALVKTLRAQFDVVVQVAGDERSASGVLLVRPPEDARMRLVAPFGMTVFDALRTNGRTYLTAPFASGTDAASLEAQRFGPGDSLLFGADAGACRADGMRDENIVYWCGTPPTRWVTINPANATLVEEGETDDGEPVVTWTYADYRLIDGVPLPFHITIDYLRPHVTVVIAVDKYEVNPPLRDDQFQPPSSQSSSLAPPYKTAGFPFCLLPFAFCLLPFRHRASGESPFCLLSSAFCLLSWPARSSGGGLKPAATTHIPKRDLRAPL